MSRRQKFRKGRSAKSFHLKVDDDKDGKRPDSESSLEELAEESDSVDTPTGSGTEEGTFKFEDFDDDIDDLDESKQKVIRLPRKSFVPEPSPEPSPEPEPPEPEPPEPEPPGPPPPILQSFEAAPKKIKRRVTKSIKDVVNMVEEDIRKDMMKDLDRETIVKESVVSAFAGGGGSLSKSLSKASNMGSKMMPKVVFPAAPKLFRDAWVFIEILLTLIQFVYAFYSTNYRQNRLYNAIYISLSIINLVLALIDAFYYFYELGSCMVLYRKCKKKMRKKRRQRDYETLDDEDSDSEIDEEEFTESQGGPACLKRCRLSAKQKEKLNTWFELVRSILSELLIYPLVVLDLFGVISDPTISDRLNFSFFLVGSFYLVLSVYIARVMIMILTLLTLRGLLSGSESGKKNVFFIMRFLLHSIAQVVVHVSCVIAVAVKVKQENDHNNGHYHASPVLWAVILGGWAIPFLGVITFFLVNYFWAQQFSVGFFIELMALLQEGDVAGSLMQSKDQMKAEAEERSKQILEKMQYKKVKEEYQTLESNSQFSKLSYPIKIPSFILLCILYNIALGGYFASLLLTSKHGNVVPVELNDYKAITLLIIVIVIALANIHLIIVTNLTLIIFLVAFCVVFFLPGLLAVPLFIGVLYVVRKMAGRNVLSELLFKNE